MKAVQHITQRAAAYPAAAVYLVAALMLAAAVQNLVLLLVALVMLAVVGCVAVVVVVHQQTVQVVGAVGQEHDRLVARCEQLSATLTAYGHAVPPRPVYIEEEQ